VSTSLDFEQGDVVAVEDKIEQVVETCKVLTEESEGLWFFRTELDKIIKYDVKKADTFKFYRYKVVGVLTEEVKK